MLEPTCALCGSSDVDQTDGFDDEASTRQCRRCGAYRITFEADINARRLVVHRPQDDRRYLVSGLCRQRTIVGGTSLLLTRENIDHIADHAPPDVPARIDALLVNLATITEQSTSAAERIRLRPEDDYPMGFCRDAAEFGYFLRQLGSQGLVEVASDSSTLLTISGWLRVRELRQTSRFHQDSSGEGARIGSATRTPTRTSGPATSVGLRIFICHASEDKDEFAGPLASSLQEQGIIVWYDEFTLRLGDSLRRSIDKGLAQADFGVVVLSPAFFQKEWPQYELDGLVQREMEGRKVILPIWHNVSSADVIRYSPTLAGRVAARSTLGVDAVVREILDAVSSVPPVAVQTDTTGPRLTGVETGTLSARETEPFRIRTQPAEGFTLQTERESYAHLVIANKTNGLLERCSVRLMRTEYVMRGHLMPEQELNRQSRYLRWSSREHAAYGKHNHWIDLPADHVERFLDLAVISQFDPNHFTLVCADPEDRPALPLGWYKVTLAIASESGASPCSQDLTLLMGRGRRDSPSPPSPLAVYEWEPHGRKILEQSAREAGEIEARAPDQGARQERLVGFISEGNELFERSRYKGPTSEAPEPIWDAAKDWLDRAEAYIREHFEIATHYTPFHTAAVRAFPPERARASREELSAFVTLVVDTLQSYINGFA